MKYVFDLLFEIGMLDCRPTNTLVAQNNGLGEFPNKTPTNKERYQRLMGMLIYLSHTWLNITYTMSLLNQFMHCPSEDHMSAVYFTALEVFSRKRTNVKKKPTSAH